MTTDLDAYRKQLLFALRVRDVPGPRIAEALAEVDSHAADSGEDPREAFGPPSEYADRLLAAWPPDGRRRIWGGPLTRGDVAVGASALGGAWLLADGLFAAAAGASTVLGLPGLVSAAAGVALLTALGAWLAWTARRVDDRVLDPRTGADMAPPVPRWTRWVLLASVVWFALAAGLGFMTR